MKETPLSTCEKTFVPQCIRENQRLDGRTIKEFRPIKINFGSDWSSVHVSIGETRVLAQVSCELGQPKSTRPNEGILYINVELSPMAAAHFEAGRNSDLNIQINRILERTFKDSKCVDLESLCVTAEDKVWIIRCDLTVLNHEGNLVDCASIAALCSLAHFRYPDVTVSGQEIKVHSSAEKDPIPLSLHHYPVCISYATFFAGEVAVADPTAIEERCSEASMIFGLNSFGELCCINLGGSMHTSTNLLLECSRKAAKRAVVVVDQIKKALEEDLNARAQGKIIGFTECLRLNKITSLADDKLFLKCPNFSLDKPYKPPVHVKSEESPDEGENSNVMNISEDTGVLNSNQPNIKWIDEDEDSDDDDDDGNMSAEDEILEHELENIQRSTMQRQNQSNSSKIVTSARTEFSDTSSDSEEDSTMQLG